MHPVFRLAPDGGPPPVDDWRRHFLATARRQAMHEPGAWGERHEPFVDPVLLERGAAFIAVRAAHRDPDVGVDDVGAFDRLGRIGHSTLETVTRRTCDDEFRADQRTSLGKRARDVVAFPDECHTRSFEAAQQLPDGQQISERLQRMVAAREHVEHRRGIHRRHSLEQFVVEHARGDDRMIAGERARHIIDALAAADAEFSRLQVDWMAAELRGREFHRVARPSARLLEVERDSLIPEDAHRGLFGQSEDCLDIGGAEVRY